MTKEETKKVILSKIEEMASEKRNKLQDIREKDENGEYLASQDGYSCDFTKDALYDVVEESIDNMYFLYGFIDGLLNHLN